MPADALSVVIPTRDRCETLAKCLRALEAQDETAGELEVVVILDGSRDDSAAMLEALSPKRFRLEVVAGPPRGPAAARNVGVRRARGERVLLLGDDTFPAPGTLGVHARFGAEEVGVQGPIEWDESVGVTPVMRFLAPEGPQFYFRGLSDGGPMEYWRASASNLSLPRRWLLEEPFDEGFPDAAFEDTEAARRWARRGWPLVWAVRAVCLHHHRYETIEPFLARQRRAGRAARYAVGKYPGLAWRAFVQPVIAGTVSVARSALARLSGPLEPERTWDLACRRAFLAGFLSAGRE